jgi:hypothetical protein
MQASMSLRRTISLEPIDKEKAFENCVAFPEIASSAKPPRNDVVPEQNTSYAKLDSRLRGNDSRQKNSLNKSGNQSIEQFKPYYVAHTKVQTIALLENSDNGSNWLQSWKRWESNPRPKGSC